MHLPDSDPSDNKDGAATLLPDLWDEIDAPVLEAVARWELRDSPDGSFLGTEELLARLGHTSDEARMVGASVARLARGGYLEAGALTLGWPYPHWVTRLTPAGLRCVGVWPNPKAAVDGVVDALDELAQRLDQRSPDQAQRLRAVLPWLGGAFREVGVDLASRILVRAAGLG